MKREDVLKLIPDATEDQITALLNAHHAELSAKGKETDDLKVKLEQVQTLEEQLEEAKRQQAELEQQKEEAENKNLSQVELLQKELKKNQDASSKQIADLQAALAKSEVTSYAASKGFVGEQAENVLKAFSGNIELSKAAIDNLSAMIEQKETDAVSAYEKKLLEQTGSPLGSAGGNGGDSIAMQLARKLTPTKTGIDEDALNRLRR